ncbi:hypothetical protein BRARA_B02872 [Brassica rapa]|uniref:Pentacotripeptide-repeat region of PRORP domain-containing protein n=1 Tax=Brassica campestris TaxID=3711 RepID=A0A398AEC8_BRACM|nr:hypothetical protein BRARA_B02872 [Brassica rapa]
MFKWLKEITPSHVIKLMRAEKDKKKLISVFDSATAEYTNGFLHDQSSFGYTVSRLVSTNKFKAAEDRVARKKTENCAVSEDVLLSISRGYGRVHMPVDSLRVFHKMKDFDCDLTHKGYVTVLAILVEENQLKLAFKFYKNMREIGLPPTVASLNVLIKALCINRKTVDAGVKIFLEMPKRGCDLDSYKYGTLISGFCQFGRIDQAKKLFEVMVERDCLPVTYTSMIHGLCGSMNVEEALRYLEKIKILDGLCKDGRALQAMELFETMMARGCRPNMVTYSTLITGLCKEGKIQGEFQKTVQLVNKIVADGCIPNKGTWKVLVGHTLDKTIVGDASAESLLRDLEV